MADMDFSQAFTYSDINKVYLMAVELSGGLVSHHGSVQLEQIFQDSTLYAQVLALKNSMGNIMGAEEYDDTATYAVGDYCVYNDYLYRCITAVSAESWDVTKWDLVSITSESARILTEIQDEGDRQVANVQAKAQAQGLSVVNGRLCMTYTI